MTGQFRKADNIPRAVIAIIAAVLALSFGDALIKLFSVDLPVWQLFVLRSAFAAPVLVMLMRGRRLAPVGLAWAVARSLLLMAMWVLYYAALPHVSLAVAAAGYYTIPLFITLFSAPLLGERVGRRGWAAVSLGFVGVLVMLRPDPADLSLAMFLPVAAAMLYALAMILTRAKCRHEDPLALSLALNVTFVVVGGAVSISLWGAGFSEATVAASPFLLGEWAETTLSLLGACAVLAAAILVGSIGAAIAYQSAPAALIGAFDYSYLAFAALWGVLFFAEFPDVTAIVGMAMIVSAGVIVLKR